MKLVGYVSRDRALISTITTEDIPPSSFIDGVPVSQDIPPGDRRPSRKIRATVNARRGAGNQLFVEPCETHEGLKGEQIVLRYFKVGFGWALWGVGRSCPICRTILEYPDPDFVPELDQLNRAERERIKYTKKAAEEKERKRKELPSVELDDGRIAGPYLKLLAHVPVDTYITTSELIALTGLPRNKLSSKLTKLVQSKYIQRVVGKGRGQQSKYRRI